MQHMSQAWHKWLVWKHVDEPETQGQHDDVVPWAAFGLWAVP